MIYKKIKDVSLSDESTWRENIFLTFDFDWCCDAVLEDTIELVERAGLSATWFVTHDTPLLARLRSNRSFELGIHPNFNNLLLGDSSNGENSIEVVEQIIRIVPESRSVRSHSLAQSSRLLQLFSEKGLTYDCNSFIPEQSGLEIKPWSLWNGMVKVPHFWEDDLACLYTQNTPIKELGKRKGLKGFAFHPIHVFLNTENLDHFERTREFHRRPEELIKYRYKGVGVRTQLEKIMGLIA